ncbi:hypothetical protein F5Y08DRAFT_167213 [Xylaria arbuscula]|nr:hypothetical protein F5Y08DRAFT_167213 [Xylaria arbuscula]
MLDHSRNLGGEEEPTETGDIIAQTHSHKKYKCPQCPSSFKRPENLKRHQRGHDDSRRFTCQVCGKSFARSDILGRHVSTHTPLERPNDNPHRRRACRECARARERCSRGEPCRRCSTKALCCLYPEEHQFKTMTPSGSSPSNSEPGHYNGAGVGWFDPHSPQETPFTLGSSMLQDNIEPLEWPIEDSPDPSRRLSTLSASSYGEVHQTSLPSPFGSDALPLGHQRTTSWATSTIGMDDMGFAPDSAQLEATMGFHAQLSTLPLDMASTTSPMSFHQSGFSPDPQDYSHNEFLDGGHFNADFYSQNSHITHQPPTLDFWNSMKSHEYHHLGFQTPNLEIDDPETYFQSGPQGY